MTKVIVKLYESIRGLLYLKKGGVFSYIRTKKNGYCIQVNFFPSLFKLLFLICDIPIVGTKCIALEFVLIFNVLIRALILTHLVKPLTTRVQLFVPKECFVILIDAFNISIVVTVEKSSEYISRTTMLLHAWKRSMSLVL